MDPKEIKFETKVEKTLRGWGILENKYDDVAELFEQVGDSFKLLKPWDKATGAYIKLADFHLKEPELLSVDAERIRRQMQEVAVGNYRSFISAAKALQAISLEVAYIDHHLESMIAEIPQLTSGCNDFISSAQQILEKRELNQTLLGNHSTLLELLEIPQLMDTCVRNGNYDEALDLEAFVSKLVTMHPRLAIIQSLAADVKQTTSLLRAQLLQRLRSSIQLPECLRIIGYLRRLGDFSEHEMRLQFLRCREAWLMGIITDLDQRNPYEYLKRLADCHRIHLFDVVTQYRAIFADDTLDHEENSDGGFLYSWAMHRISSYLEILQELLPKITEGVSLAIILEQSMYCGMSLGRVGLDFRGLLPSLFEDSVHDLFVRNMALTMENFQHALNSHRWVPLPQGRITRGGSNGEENLDDVAPPQSLMEHPPLATFVNGILAALNELRHCAPLNIKATLASELQQTLQCIADSLLRHHAARMLRENEITQFLSMCRVFVEVACPYCVLCFGRCYSGGSSLIQTKEIVESLRRLINSNPYGSMENGDKTSHPLQGKSQNLEQNGKASDDVDVSVMSFNVPHPGQLENGQANTQTGIEPHISN